MCCACPVTWHTFSPLDGTSILPLLGYKAAGSKELEHVKVECYNYTEARYAIFFATIMGCVATPVTSWCVMGLNYVLCVYDGLKIAFKFKKEGHSNACKFQKIHINSYHLTIINFSKECRGLVLHGIKQ